MTEPKIMKSNKFSVKHKVGEEIYISILTLDREILGTMHYLKGFFKDNVEGEILDIVDANVDHFCGCGGISHSPDENVLCEECRMLYGHAFESDL